MHRLLFLDPGHFHATLTLREPNPRVADEIVVYAPDGPERRDFLALVERFNARGTRWRVDVVTSTDPLDRLIAERRGDVVVLAGKNGGKARTMRRLHEAGFHVLADKPWLVEPEDRGDIEACLAGWPLATEIMTGRHDVPARLLQRLVATKEVFGEFRGGESPGLEMDGAHHLEKLVDGAPLRRPWWFFDVRVQGRGIVDIPTHLVDRAQWLVAGTPRLVSARSWATRVPGDAFRRITGESGWPPHLASRVAGDALEYECNTELVFEIDGVTVKGGSRWDVEAGADTSLLIARGTRAEVRLEHSVRTGHRRTLMIQPQDRGAVGDAIRAAQADFPGVHAEDRDGGVEIVVPAGLDGGHETHFPLVLDQFLTSIDGARWPADVATRTREKYAVLAEAAATT
jgi:predicted dehydrogenase